MSFHGALNPRQSWNVSGGTHNFTTDLANTTTIRTQSIHHAPNFLLGGLVFLHVITTLFIAARLYSRLLALRKPLPGDKTPVRRKPLLDDGLAVLAWITATVVCVLYSINAVLAYPRVHGDNPPPTFHGYLALIFYQLSLTFTKASIIFLYMRIIFAGKGQIMRICGLGTAIVVSLSSVALLVMSGLQCRPTARRTYQILPHTQLIAPMPQPRCLDFTPLLIASAVIHAVVNTWLVGLAWVIIGRLKLITSQPQLFRSMRPTAISIALSLPALLVVCGLVRLGVTLGKAEGTDGTWLNMMTLLECDLALICAGIPALKPLLLKYCPKLVLLGVDDEARLETRREAERGLVVPSSSGSIPRGSGSSQLEAIALHRYPNRVVEPSTQPSGVKRSGRFPIPSASPGQLRDQPTLPIRNETKPTITTSTGASASAQPGASVAREEVDEASSQKHQHDQAEAMIQVCPGTLPREQRSITDIKRWSSGQESAVLPWDDLVRQRRQFGSRSVDTTPTQEREKDESEELGHKGKGEDAVLDRL